MEGIRLRGVVVVMEYVALLFAVFAVIVSIVALMLEIRNRSMVKRALGSSHSSSDRSCLRRERKVFAYGFSIGPVGDAGILVTSTGGTVLGVGTSNGPFPVVGPPSTPADALDQNAITEMFVELQALHHRMAHGKALRQTRSIRQRDSIIRYD